MRGWFLAAVAWPVAGLVAQAPPGTDVYLASLKRSGGSVSIGTPVNLTHRPGYDNQPFFAPDGRSIFYTVVRPGGPNGTTQADIFRLDLATRNSTPVIETPESEYSATLMPGGREISVIRVERDSTQRLWAFPLDGKGAPRLLLERVKPVGYQAWLDEKTVGVFVLGSPATLQVADLATGNARILLPGIGRALHRIPGRRALSVPQQVADSVWWVMEVDPATAKATPLVKLLPGAEYYVWLPDGSLLSAQGNAIFRAIPRAGAANGSRAGAAIRSPAWTRVAIFDHLKTITRLAVNAGGDRLAFVAEDGPP